MITSAPMRLGIALGVPSGRSARLRRIVSLALAASAPVTLATRAASATDCSGIYSPCINDDIVWPHSGPSRFVMIGSTETVASGQLGFGLATTVLTRSIVLNSAAPGPGGSSANAVDSQANGTFLWAYGVTDRLELDLAVPLTFIQSGAGLSPVTGGSALKDTAVRDMRFGLAYAIVPHARIAPEKRSEAWGLAARLEISAPTGDVDQFASDGVGVFVPSIAADWRRGKLFAGVEVGARLRPTSNLEGARVGPQLVTALGVGYDILPRELLTATLEAMVLPTFAEQDTVQNVQQVSGVMLATPNGNYIAPAAWQLAARTAPLPGGDFSIQLGGGGGLPITSGAITMPQFLFTLGVRWAPLGHKAPKPPATAAPAQPAVDLHLADARDVCTSDPDVVDGFKDSNGCPDEDQDKDGIPDRLDQCPLVPEDFAGIADGCPEKH
jgi:OOP family OmpA-OmpF porin